MNSFRVFLFCLVMTITSGLSAQQEVLMTIDGKPVTLAEFERIYHKNSSIQNPADSKGVNDYLDLFINFKLKVIEAENQGLDTLESFRTELNGYREQLAKSYLKDTTYEEKMIQEAYQRMLTDLNVSHILIRCKQDAPAADTLAAWNKIMKIRQRLMKGESFETVARSSSEDANAKDNGGNVGWISAFFMPYPFENAAYNLKPGEISQPVRTGYGYHLIMVKETRPSQGEVLVAHIFKAIPPKSAPGVAEHAEAAIKAIADSIKMGYDFATLAKHNSEDRYSAMQGGELPWFGIGRMIPEFEKAAFALKANGDISDPIKSSYGWHIIKRLDRRTILPFTELRAGIKNQMNYSQRNQVAQTNWLQQLKTDYHFKEYPGALSQFYTKIDSAFAMAPEKGSPARFNGMNAPLFSIGDKTYNQSDFVNYIFLKGKNKRGFRIEPFVNGLYNDYVKESVLAYEKSQLDRKYPEFRYLMQEYHDGILLFDLTDRLVWSKAVRDTAGLRKFYEANRNRYQWNERIEATVYSCKDSATALQAMKLAEKKPKKGQAQDWIAIKLCPTDSTHSCVQTETQKFEKGDNPIIDKSGWTKGVTSINSSNGKFIFAVKTALIPTGPKSLQEARGLVTADYQDYLEKEWVKELRSKYKVDVDKNVLAKVK